MVAEHGLGGGTERKPLLQLFTAAHSDPCHLRRKAVDQLSLLFQQVFGDQRGHRHIDVAGFLEFTVQNVLDVFPDGVAVWTQDHKSLHAGIVDQFCFFADIGIPLGKIVLHTGDLFNFFILCHDVSLNFNLQYWGKIPLIGTCNTLFYRLSAVLSTYSAQDPNRAVQAIKAEARLCGFKKSGMTEPINRKRQAARFKIAAYPHTECSNQLVISTAAFRPIHAICIYFVER